MGWITPIAFLLCHTYSIGDAATLETFSSKSVLSPERGALTGHFRKYLGFACRVCRRKQLDRSGRRDRLPAVEPVVKHTQRVTRRFHAFSRCHLADYGELQAAKIRQSRIV